METASLGGACSRSENTFAKRSRLFESAKGRPGRPPGPDGNPGLPLPPLPPKGVPNPPPSPCIPGILALPPSLKGTDSCGNRLPSSAGGCTGASRSAIRSDSSGVVGGAGGGIGIGAGCALVPADGREGASLLVAAAFPGLFNAPPPPAGPADLIAPEPPVPEPPAPKRADGPSPFGIGGRRVSFPFGIDSKSAGRSVPNRISSRFFWGQADRPVR